MRFSQEKSQVFGSKNIFNFFTPSAVRLLMGSAKIMDMKIKIQSNDQLEMTFNANVRCSSQERRRLRRNRAAEWFQHMRQVVERAVDWAPAPEPRPEQIWFPEPANAGRQATAAAEQQMAA
jgi:hypothetical protein